MFDVICALVLFVSFCADVCARDCVVRVPTCASVSLFSEKFTLGFKRELAEYLVEVAKLHEVGGTGVNTDTVRCVPTKRVVPRHTIESFLSRRFLLSKRKKWPEFVHVASYWVSIATSSIAAERIFGIMRAIMQDNRGAADPETWARELMLRCNVTVLLAMLSAAVEEFQAKW